MGTYTPMLQVLVEVGTWQGSESACLLRDTPIVVIAEGVGGNIQLTYDVSLASCPSCPDVFGMFGEWIIWCLI